MLSEVNIYSELRIEYAVADFQGVYSYGNAYREHRDEKGDE
jgi:hypothetical protein